MPIFLLPRKVNGGLLACLPDAFAALSVHGLSNHSGTAAELRIRPVAHVDEPYLVRLAVAASEKMKKPMHIGSFAACARARSVANFSRIAARKFCSKSGAEKSYIWNFGCHANCAVRAVRLDDDVVAACACCGDAVASGCCGSNYRTCEEDGQWLFRGYHGFLPYAQGPLVPRPPSVPYVVRHVEGSRRRVHHHTRRTA